MQNSKQPSHIRLPQRSALVRGKKDAIGHIVKKPDRRAEAQEPDGDRERKPKVAHQASPAPAATATTPAAGKSATA
jgi:hypothetical protein